MCFTHQVLVIVSRKIHHEIATASSIIFSPITDIKTYFGYPVVVLYEL